MKKLDRSAPRLFGGLTEKEFDKLKGWYPSEPPLDVARRRSKKKTQRKHLNPGEQRARPGRSRVESPIFSGEGSRDMWDTINSLKRFYTNGTRRGTDFDQTWNALYTIGCKLQEFESFVRSNIKGRHDLRRPENRKKDST